jgi:xanthine/uracil permease
MRILLTSGVVPAAVIAVVLNLILPQEAGARAQPA